jgi:hypothetical protein
MFMRGFEQRHVQMHAGDWESMRTARIQQLATSPHEIPAQQLGGRGRERAC